MPTSANQGTYLLGQGEGTLRRYRLFNQLYEPATRDRLSTLEIAPDAQVLEIGCGIGDTACMLATEIVPDGHVTAFDQASDLIRIGEEQAAARGIDNITFLCSAAHEFDFGAEQFDVAHTRYVLTYLPDAADIVRDAYRALKPGGALFAEEVAQLYIVAGETSWYERMCEWFAGLIDRGGGNADYGVRRLVPDMLAAGFADIRATAHWPLQDQTSIVDMLRLALSREMKRNIVSLGMASDEEVDAVIAMLDAPKRTYTISPSVVAQATGKKASA